MLQPFLADLIVLPALGVDRANVPARTVCKEDDRILLSRGPDIPLNTPRKVGRNGRVLARHYLGMIGVVQQSAEETAFRVGRIKEENTVVHRAFRSHDVRIIPPRMRFHPAVPH